MWLQRRSRSSIWASMCPIKVRGLGSHFEAPRSHYSFVTKIQRQNACLDYKQPVARVAEGEEGTRSQRNRQGCESGLALSARLYQVRLALAATNGTGIRRIA